MSCIDRLYTFFYYAIVIVVLFYCLAEDDRMSSRNMLEGTAYITTVSLVCILLVLLSTCIHCTFTFMGEDIVLPDIAFTLSVGPIQTVIQ
jgi:hypothetical protein